MFAAVSTWQFSESLFAPEDQVAFVRKLVASGVSEVRSAGAIDILLVIAEPDRLIGITCFEDMESLVATNAVTEQVADTRFPGHLRFISREVGAMYEPSEVLAVNRDEILAQREKAGGTATYMARWSLDDSIEPEHVGEWVYRIWRENADFLRELGLLDRFVVQVGPRELLAINLFSVGEAGDIAYHRAISERPKMISGQATFVSGEIGRAWDIPDLLDR